MQGLVGNSAHGHSGNGGGFHEGRLTSLSHHIPQYCAPRRQDLERVAAPLTLRVILEDSEKCQIIPTDFSLCTWAKGTSAAVMGAVCLMQLHLHGLRALHAFRRAPACVTVGADAYADVYSRALLPEPRLGY
jgi:hypothetical protein